MKPFTGRAVTVLFLLAALIGVSARVWFSGTTRLTLEDAFITFRYAENISAGKGFVYNEGERVLGTTTPLWTLILAAARSAGATDPVATSRAAGIIFDLAALALLYLLFKGRRDFLMLCAAAMLALSPGIVAVSGSGMETPLLLLLMTGALWAYDRKSDVSGILLGLIILTRVDGALFSSVLVAVAFRRERRWAMRQVALAALVLLPWIVFSLSYFHGILPQSLTAKAAQYHMGFRASADPFLGTFTPLGEANPFKWALKLLLFPLLAWGWWVSVRRGGVSLVLAVFFCCYSVLFMCSGVLIFYWYMVPAIYASVFLEAAGLEWLLEKFAPEGRPALAAWAAVIVLLALTLGNAAVLTGRAEKFRQVQSFEEDLRKRIGLWLRDNVEPGSSVLLEPIGYIGYYAGPGVRILDEVGLVTPGAEVTGRDAAGWYIGLIRSLNPDYIVEYSSAIRENRAMVVGRPLFRDDGERRWFAVSYEMIASFEARGRYPLVEDAEKSFMVFRRSKR